MINKIFGSLGLLIVAGALGWFLVPENPLKSWLQNSTGQTASANGADAKDKSAGAVGKKGEQRKQTGRPSSGGRGRGPRETLVVTRPVSIAVSGDRLTSIGDGEAAASAVVLPSEAGILTEVMVKSGDRVSRGDLLARLDSESEEIARDLSQRNVEDATIVQKRVAKLVQSRAGSQADLDQANNALARAKLDLRDSELKLTRRLITAPIDGSVGIVAVTRGSRVTTSSEIVTIDDRSRLLINFRVPERFASRISVGQQVEATSFAISGMQTGTVVGVGNRVDSNSRTLPVQAEIDNSDDQLRTGMAFSVTLRFEGEQLPAVNPLAVQWDSSGSFVWKVVDDKAMRTDIQIVQRNTDSVLVRAKLSDKDEVVTEGVMSLRNGAAVRINGRQKKQQADPANKKPLGNKPAGKKPASNKQAGEKPAAGARPKPVGDKT